MSNKTSAEPVIVVHLVDRGLAICSGAEFQSVPERYATYPREFCQACQRFRWKLGPQITYTDTQIAQSVQLKDGER